MSPHLATTTPAGDEPLPPLVVTLRMGHAAASRFTALRRRHFPPQRNWLDAHLTLFHALPGARLDTVRADAAEVAARTAPFTMRTVGLRFLGHGVAYALASSEAEALRETLARRWQGLASRQDRAGLFRPHVTVQNKVSADAARALHAWLAEEFEPEDIPAVGLDLWHYEGGPWRAAASFPFVASVPSSSDGTRRDA